jgi:hypothetical protein
MAGTGHGPEGAPAHWYNFADFLRRALHAAADQVEPQADGLEPIRAKIPAGRGLRDHQRARRRHRHLVRRSARRDGPGTGTQRP